MEFTTSRLLLDALKESDADALFSYRADPAVARFQGWRPASINDARDFIETQASIVPNTPDSWLQRAIRLREGNVLVGDLGLHFPADADDSIEFGISLAPLHQGKGYASEALRAVLAWSFGELGRRRVHASVDPRNHASITLLRAIGMRQEAHYVKAFQLHGEWVDDVIFVMLADEWHLKRD
ncbi:GNAT family N-acetyltransferase [Dyella tabacisoli]|uniref:N-acetyltransferase n=1 Tax=Dyella tabacisoli TaxID=2282381 RepID=A0A369USC3_9GAMM|nr:GNAT family protein [Dyella tabacisoli]RDD83421.1 N-acetyltransferase [Dyella tabacisoli]